MKRENLINEIKEMMNVFDPMSLPMEDLVLLHELLQPSVDMWNDAEQEYQHLVDTMGEGTSEYNYDRYIANTEEKKLIKKIQTQNVDTYFCFMTKEAINKVSKDYVEHKTGAKLEFDYNNCVIKINK